MKDLRDCSGPWSGFWIQDMDRGTMKLRLRFFGERIEGEGNDEIDDFTVVGNYSPATEAVRLSKRYPSHLVEYNGSWDGSMISGRWRIRPRKGDGGHKDSGGFDLWPDTEEESIATFTEVAVDRIPVPA